MLMKTPIVIIPFNGGNWAPAGSHLYYVKETATTGTTSPVATGGPTPATSSNSTSRPAIPVPELDDNDKARDAVLKTLSESTSITSRISFEMYGYRTSGSDYHDHSENVLVQQS